MDNLKVYYVFYWNINPVTLERFRAFKKVIESNVNLALLNSDVEIETIYALAVNWNFRFEVYAVERIRKLNSNIAGFEFTKKLPDHLLYNFCLLMLKKEIL